MRIPAPLRGWRLPVAGAVLCYGLMGALVVESRMAASRAGAEADAAAMLLFRHSDGPFALYVQPDGSRRLGDRLPAVRPGEPFAYTNEACLRADVEMRGEVRLRRVADGAIVWRATFVTPRGERPCGGQVHVMAAPEGTPAGVYELVREDLVLIPAAGAPQERDLPPLRIVVAP